MASFETVDFIIGIEHTFGVPISDSEAEKLPTIGDLEQFMIRKLEAEHRSSRGVYEAIIRVLVEEFNRKPNRLSRQTTFIDDLMLESTP